MSKCVQCCSLQFTDTELTRKVLSQEQIDELVAQVPIKRLALPEEIAHTVVYLSSDKNSFMTGQNILIDGGFTSV